MKFITVSICLLIGVLALSTLAQAQSNMLYKEPFRPQYHYSPPQGWMNDPNGLVYYEGEYHLFYQYHPDDVVWGPMHWGHAVTTDLVHWETLPIALYPDELGTIFSGTVVIDANNTSGLVPGGGLVALYSYDNQTQGAAYSTDRGRTWQKYAGNPILPALTNDFRDPKVFWHEASKRWVMAISAGESIMFLTSSDLLVWTVASTFSGGYSGGVWEVPDLIPMTVNGQTKWVLIVSVNPTAPAGGSGTRYYVGGFDGETFIDDTPEIDLWFDYGPDNYAGTTWNNAPDNRHIFLSWMNNWDYANTIPTSTWRGAMTLPRELSLTQTPEGIRLRQTPVKELAWLRQPVGTWANLTITDEMSLEGLQGQQLEIIADFELGTATLFGFDVLAGDNQSTRIAYNVAAQKLIVSRLQSEIKNFNPIFMAPLMPIDNHIRLHILIDQSSVEIFGNDGLLAVTSQVFSSAEKTGVSLFARGGTATLISFEAHTLASIWNN
jgi:fructan beta-fructosidase